MARYFLAFLFLIFSASSFAYSNDAGAPDYQYQPSWWHMINDYQTASEACTSNWGIIKSKTAWNNYLCEDTRNSSFVNNVFATCKTGTLVEYPSATAACRSASKQCPSGSTLSNGACTCSGLTQFVGGKCIEVKTSCPKGQILKEGECVNESCTSYGIAIAKAWYPIKPFPPSLICVSGCRASRDDFAFAKALDKGVLISLTQAQYLFTGQGDSDKCTASDSPSGSASLPTNTCAAGQSLSVINGKTGCADQVTGDTKVTLDDKKTDTTTTTTQDANGNKTTTTNKTNGDGSTTKTVTVTTPSGDTTTSTTETGTEGDKNGDGKDDFCDQHPQSPSCRDLGDAPTPEDLTKNDQNVSVNPAGGFGSGSYQCPQNPVAYLATAKRSMEIFNWEPVCTVATGVKPVIIAFSLLAAALIVVGATKGS